MVVLHDVGMLAVAALVSVTSEHKRKCRENLRAAAERLEKQAPGTRRGDRMALEAAGCLRTACAACGRCPGI